MKSIAPQQQQSQQSTEAKSKQINENIMKTLYQRRYNGSRPPDGGSNSGISQRVGKYHHRQPTPQSGVGNNNNNKQTHPFSATSHHTTASRDNIYNKNISFASHRGSQRDGHSRHSPYPQRQHGARDAARYGSQHHHHHQQQRQGPAGGGGVDRQQNRPSYSDRFHNSYNRLPNQTHSHHSAGGGGGGVARSYRQHREAMLQAQVVRQQSSPAVDVAPPVHDILELADAPPLTGATAVDALAAEAAELYTVACAAVDDDVDRPTSRGGAAVGSENLKHLLLDPDLQQQLRVEAQRDREACMRRMSGKSSSS